MTIARSARSTSTLALLGGEAVGTIEPPRFPTFTAAAKARVQSLLDVGPMVGLSKRIDVIREAEETIATWHEVPHCLGTASGHGALQAALIGLEVTGGAEVVASPYSWGASVSCVLHNNAIPVFADVDPVTGLLDPDAAERAIGPRARAILVTHIFGQPADMTALQAVANRHGIALIEDGSQAHGARHRGARVGGFGDAAGFSCMGGKLLATSEAGYLLTRHESVYWNAILSGQHAGGTEHPGRAAEPGFPTHHADLIDSLNYTHRLSTINAVLLVEQLAKLGTENEGRRANRQALIDALRDVGSVSFPTYPDADEPVFHMVTLRFDPNHAGVAKRTYIEALRAEGVRIFSYIERPLHRSPRLAPDYDGPAVMWSAPLRQAGIDYRELELPGCDAKVERSLEMTWNYVLPDADAMRRLADAFVKVEENLPALRAYEHAS